MQSNRFQRACLTADPEYKINVRKNLAVIEQIYAILDEKGWSQKQLAAALGKSESEISKWLSGTHNLTLLTISRIEAVLGTDILITPKQAQQRAIPVKTDYIRSGVDIGNYINAIRAQHEHIAQVSIGSNQFLTSSKPIDFHAKWEQIKEQLNNKLEIKDDQEDQPTAA